MTFQDVTLQFSTVPWVVFRGDPRPDDIRQGGVGNCWFVCALSCLAEYPHALKQIIPTHEYNPAGAYQVRVRVRGTGTGTGTGTGGLGIGPGIRLG